jgi:ParB family chromosome partitioning protein
VSLPTGELNPSPSNPRKSFDQEELKELARSIAAQGVIEPLIVRSRKEGGYEVVAGERRLRAAKLAKLSELPCLVRQLTDRQVMEVQLVENLERRDLSALEEAEGFAALIALSKRDGGEAVDVPAVAKRIGKSESYVFQRLKLIELIDPLKKMLNKGEITAGHAILVARLKPEAQTSVMEHQLKDAAGISVRQLAQAIKQEKAPKKPVAADQHKKQEMVKLQKKLAAQTEAKNETVNAILAAVTEHRSVSSHWAVAIHKYELHMLVQHLLREAPHEHLEVLFHRHKDEPGWAIPQKQDSAFSLQNWLEKKMIPKWSDLTVWRLVVELLLIPAIASPQFSNDGWRDAYLKMAAAGYGVDVVKAAGKKEAA